MTPKPYLLVVTGRPGSGKTTFAKALGEEIFMPVVSRDQIKEGYVRTFGKRHTELPPEANGVASDVFFDTVRGLLDNKVSVIAEAAFQHKIWAPALERLYDIARIYLLICRVDGKIALDRFIKRGLADGTREYFHGDKGVDMARAGLEVTVSPYEEPRLDVPAFYIDTTGEYAPSVKDLAKLILK